MSGDGGESERAAERRVCAQVRGPAAEARECGRKVRYHEISLALPNGARIVGLPGNEGTARGFTAPGMVIIDEAARVPDELYLSMRPVVMSGNGALWLMSTPWGKRGFFYDVWAGGDPLWTRGGGAGDGGSTDAAGGA